MFYSIQLVCISMTGNSSDFFCLKWWTIYVEMGLKALDEMFKSSLVFHPVLQLVFV